MSHFKIKNEYEKKKKQKKEKKKKTLNPNHGGQNHFDVFFKRWDLSLFSHPSIPVTGALWTYSLVNYICNQTLPTAASMFTHSVSYGYGCGHVGCSILPRFFVYLISKIFFQFFSNRSTPVCFANFIFSPVRDNLLSLCSLFFFRYFATENFYSSVVAIFSPLRTSFQSEFISKITKFGTKLYPQKNAAFDIDAASYCVHLRIMIRLPIVLFPQFFRCATINLEISLRVQLDQKNIPVFV